METQESTTPMNTEPQGFLAKYKMALIGGVIALVVLVGGFVYYKQYTSTPEYIVSQMLAAYSKRNAEEFEKYFDVDDFSRMLWTDYKEWWEKDKDSIWAPLRKTIDSADAVKVTIRNIASGKKNLDDIDTIEESNERTVSMARLLDKMHGYTISAVADEGDTKKFRLTAKTFDEQEFAFDLTVKRKGDYWKICELRNVGEVCTSFKNFAKDSLVDYLKRSQPIQDKYEEMNAEADKMYGYSLYKRLDPSKHYYKDNNYYRKSAEAVIAYLGAKADADGYRLEELKKMQVNPFSSVLNGNRITTSEHNQKYYTLMKQWGEEGLAAKSYSTQTCKDLLKESKEAREQMEKYNNRVSSLINSVGYKAN